MIGSSAAGESAAAPGVEPLIESQPFVIPEGVESASSRLSFVPYLAIALALTWLGAMGWLGRGALSLADPIALVQFVAALCVVPALLGIVWLVVARADHAHAARLVAGAREMRAESQELARTVTQLAATMAANRDSLADQARALTALGDSASARLASIGRGLSE